MHVLASVAFIVILAQSSPAAVRTLQSQPPPPPQQPARVIELPMDYPPLPGTWEGMLAKADFAAIVRLGGSRYAVSSSGFVTTTYQAETIEIFKNDDRVSGPAFEISRVGGIKQTPQGAILYQEPRFPRWSSGMITLVLLKWDEPFKAFFPLFGPDGSYQFDQGSKKVRTFGVGKLARKLNGQAFANVVSEVRTKAIVR